MVSTKRAHTSRRSPRAGRVSWLVAASTFLLASAFGSEALASTCYQQPFGNPDLADGWHSTCCGRTNPHQGVDYPQGAGTPIPAVADGTIAKVTTSGCLGNVVVVAHADGMFSGYSHMNSASPLGVGTPVKRGQTIGYVGNTGTCSQGAHLHLTMANGVEGYGNGNNVDPYAYIEAHKQCNPPPTGHLDQADCDVVRGWAFDPDAGAAAIGTHLYFDAPAPSGHGVPLVAGQQRDDLCGVVGSCNHGYSWPTPYSLFNGQAHAVHAYGIDAPGGDNPQLGSSPRSFICAPPTPKGVKRHIPNPTVLAAWHFDGFQDGAPIDAKIVDALPDGTLLPAAPATIRGSGATVWLVDGKIKRSIGSPAVMEAWHLSFDDVKIKPDAEIAAMPDGPPLRARPLMVKDSQARLLIVDDGAPVTSGGSGGASGKAGASGAGSAGGKGGKGGAAGMGTSAGGAVSSAGGGGTNASGGATTSVGGGTSNAGGKASGSAGAGSGEARGGGAGLAGRAARGDDPAYEPADEGETGSCALARPFAAAPVWAPSLIFLAALRRGLRRRRA